MDSRGDCTKYFSQCHYKPSKEKVDEEEANWPRNSISLKECYNGESHHQASHKCYYSQQKGEGHEAWAVNGVLILLQQSGIVHTDSCENCIVVNSKYYSSVCNAIVIVTSTFIQLGKVIQPLDHIWERPLQT